MAPESGTGHMLVPSDMDEANREWKANCGPCSLAALLGGSVQQMRPAFPHFPGKAGTTIEHMQFALRHFGLRHSMRYGIHSRIPDFGLITVVWPKNPTGQRINKRSERAVYHWVCKFGDYVFDPILRFWADETNWKLYSTGALLNHYPGIQEPVITGTISVLPARQILKKNSDPRI